MPANYVRVPLAIAVICAAAASWGQSAPSPVSAASHDAVISPPFMASAGVTPSAAESVAAPPGEMEPAAAAPQPYSDGYGMPTAAPMPYGGSPTTSPFPPPTPVADADAGGEAAQIEPPVAEDNASAKPVAGGASPTASYLDAVREQRMAVTEERKRTAEAHRLNPEQAESRRKAREAEMEQRRAAEGRYYDARRQAMHPWAAPYATPDWRRSQAEEMRKAMEEQAAERRRAAESHAEERREEIQRRRDERMLQGPGYPYPYAVTPYAPWGAPPR